MDLCDLLASDGIIASLKATSKKHALQELASIAAERSGLDQREIFNALLQRERLGFTCGMAMPCPRPVEPRRSRCSSELNISR